MGPALALGAPLAATFGGAFSTTASVGPPTTTTTTSSGEAPKLVADVLICALHSLRRKAQILSYPCHMHPFVGPKTWRPRETVRLAPNAGLSSARPGPTHSTWMMPEALPLSSEESNVMA